MTTSIPASHQPEISTQKSKALLDARRGRIVELRENGLSFREIGAVVGITRGHAHALHADAIQRMLRFRDAFGTLSVRARNCLASESLESKDAVIEALKEGWLNPKSIPLYGPRTHAEVLHWAGLS